MSLTKTEQLQEFLHQAANILILLPEHPAGDHIGAAWALALYLETQGKSATVAGTCLERLAERFAFLPHPHTLMEKLSGARDFVLAFNTTRNKILRVKSEQADEEFRIFITPEQGAIDPRDFSFIPAKYKYDCLIVVGAPDKESLGKLYEDNPDIFYEVPIVNIDRHSNNENFGQINWVELTASSVSEIVTEILEHLTKGEIAPDVAECLLAGIMSATESFQKKNTTPKALQIASRLMDRGADQQKLVRHLYKTQPFHLLKLWGRVMAGLQWDEATRLMWSLVTPEDLVQTRSDAEDLPAILEKIRNHYSAGALFMLLYPQDAGHVRALFKSHNRETLDALAKAVPGATLLQDDTLGLTTAHASLIEAETALLTTVRAALAKPAQPGT